MGKSIMDLGLMERNSGIITSIIKNNFKNRKDSIIVPIKERKAFTFLFFGEDKNSLKPTSTKKSDFFDFLEVSGYT